jgi:predicted DNA-binding ribbon-helix-helix protein
MKSTKIRPRKSEQKSQVLKRSMLIDGHKTSISLEDAFWVALQEIAETQSVRVSELVATINRDREYANLSSAVRLHVLAYYRGRSPSKQSKQA